MYALIRPFLDICLLRLKPQDLPPSHVLLGVTLVTHAVSGILLSAVTLGAGTAILAGIADTSLLAALTASVLFAHRMNARIIQTLTALAGSGTIVGVVALPVSGWFHAAQGVQNDVGLSALLLLLLIAWSIAVVAHVLRHALSVPYFVGLVTAIVFYWISVTVLDSFFPLEA